MLKAHCRSTFHESAYKLSQSYQASCEACQASARQQVTFRRVRETPRMRRPHRLTLRIAMLRRRVESARKHHSTRGLRRNVYWDRVKELKLANKVRERVVAIRDHALTLPAKYCTTLKCQKTFVA